MTTKQQPYTLRGNQKGYPHMARITARHKDEIDMRMAWMENRVSAGTAYMTTENFLSLFWDEKTCELATLVGSKIDRDCLNRDHSCQLPVVKAPLPEGMPVEDNTIGYEVRLDGSSIGRQLMPSTSDFRRDAPAELMQEITDIGDDFLKAGLVVRYWKTIRNLVQICTSHEAVRYLFPGYVYVLRTSAMPELSDIASGIETIKRVPALPELNTYDRQVIRFMNEWFATQMLLGTFEGNPTYRNHNPPHNMIRISLNSVGDIYAPEAEDEGVC